jgi:ubiquinone/menaquinone biosynthesis C-methylase UbiE
VDVLPYATRGIGGIIGTDPERFDESTWYVQDVCATRLPFPYKSFDFVTCSHTLEGIRDPVFLCSELVRVASRGTSRCRLV